MSFALTEKGVRVAWAASLVVALTTGLGMGWALWRPKTIVEMPAPSIRQEDGSLVLEKKPDPSAKPAQIVPRNAVVERIVRVAVQPRGVSGAEIPIIPGSSGMELPLLRSLQLPQRVRVDLTLYRLPDGLRRVVASSPDGEIIEGASVDIPVEDAKPAPKVLKWCAGFVYGESSFGDRSVGVFVRRDIAFLQVGLEATKNTYALPCRIGWEARASVGIKF